MNDKYEINTPQQLRVRILDRCLATTGKGKTTNELMDIVIEEMQTQLNLIDYSYSPRTFANDKKYVENRLTELNEIDGLTGARKLSIKRDAENRYTYSDPNLSVFKSQVTAVELKKLMDAVNLIQQIKGFDNDNEIQSILKGLDQQIKFHSTGGKQVMGLQSLVADGYHYLDDLYNCIISENVIAIDYETFAAERNKIIVHPYYLKQFNNRWFLFAFDETNNRVSNIALDRIQSLSKPLPKIYKSPENYFNAVDYFKDIIGVTNYVENPVEDIILAFTKERTPYVITKKLHESQVIMKKKADGTTIIKLNVKQNFELKSMILSYGSDVTVVKPKSLAVEIKKLANKTLKNYSSVRLK